MILDFIGKDCTLDHQAIQNRNFAARIYPEFPSGEEVALVAARIGSNGIDFSLRVRSASVPIFTATGRVGA